MVNLHIQKRGSRTNKNRSDIAWERNRTGTPSMPGQGDVGRNETSPAEVRPSSGAAPWRESSGGKAQWVGEADPGTRQDTGYGSRACWLIARALPRPQVKTE